MRSERYRWVLACNLFAILTISSGLGFYNLSVYMNQLASQRGFSIAAASNAVGVFFLVSGIAGLVIGRILQRHDARLVLIVGALLGGCAIASIGWIRGVAGLYAVYVLFGVGYACVSILPATTLITRWFDAASRPLAVSFTTTGLSLGGVVMTPLSALLFAHWPLERAMVVIACVFTLGIVPLAWFGVRSFPGTDRPDAAAPTVSGQSFARAVRTRFFIVLTAGYVVAMGTQVGAIAHLYNRGMAIATPLQASFAVSMMAAFSVLGRFVGGVLIGRVPIKTFTLANVFGQLVGFVWIANATAAMGLWIGAGVFGLTIGNLLMLQPLLLAQAFGTADYPKIYSLSQAVTMLGVASGPVLLGMIAGASSYNVGFSTYAVLSAVAFATIVAAGAVPDAAAGDAR
jgi:predicted MFS family arabinose efflux permease